MVAITVILAAVIGTFVLGLGENVNSTPQVTWDFDANETSAGTIDKITITHSGGDSIEADRLNVTGAVDDGSDNPISFTESSEFESGDTVTSGNQLILNGAGDGGDGVNTNLDGEEGDVVRVVYTAEGGGSSSVIGTYELPSDGINS